MNNPRLVCFDVNETLLDLRALDVLFDPVGGGPARRAWFAQVIATAMAMSLAGHYRDFSEVGRMALGTVAARNGWELDDGFRQRLADGLARLPAHADALEALNRLRDAGYSVAALTNSAPAALQTQLTQAGLAGAFDAMLSVDAVRSYKPGPEPYRMAARHFGVQTENMWLVAVHDWDVLGAMSAGCAGAFVSRDGAVFTEGWPAPSVQAPSLLAAAQAIIAAGDVATQ